MKNSVINIALSVFMLVFYTSCVDDDFEFGQLSNPTNLSVSTQVIGQSEEMPYGDGTGQVIFDASAEGAMTYKYIFENGSSITTSGGVYTHQFSQTGTNVYTVTVIAYGPGGTASSKLVEVEVLVTYEPPAELIEKLVGKEWRIKASVPGHFGLGPVGGVIPVEWYGAGPNEKAGVGMYDDRYIFNEDGTFTHIVDATNDDPTTDPSGTITGRINLVDQLGASGGTVEGADVLNVPFTDYTESWSISAPGGMETINLTGIGFVGYYIGGDHKYQIFDRSGNDLILRSTDGNGEFDWWFVLTSEPEGTSEPEEFESQYNTLLWEDNFDTLNTEVWNFETGNNNGWGNEELQFYTEDNASVQDGNLIINAKAESSNGFDYTSSRITTQNNFAFTYGRVDVRAKLPSGGGVWPAIWMLGADFDQVGWPETGEIDIMEYKGNVPNEIHSALHFPDNFGGSAITETTNIENAETEFHVYSVEWTEENIVFLVDNIAYHTFENTADTPFHKDFFLILNVAMGGTFGGDVDPGFTESAMVVDYVRVYQ